MEAGQVVSFLMGFIPSRNCFSRKLLIKESVWIEPRACSSSKPGSRSFWGPGQFSKHPEFNPSHLGAGSACGYAWYLYA